MEIIALQQYTDKYVSFYQGQIRNIEDGIADKLIEEGIVAEHDQISPSGDGGSSLKYIKDDFSDNGGVIEGLVEGNTGEINVASGRCAHAEGGTFAEAGDQIMYTINTASGEASHAEGSGTTASGKNSHTEGSQTTASEYCSHAEGAGTTASGLYSHAEGYYTTASEEASHAEGYGVASGIASHAEGGTTTASGDYSHAEGNGTTASGHKSHTEGDGTVASGDNSHAEGNNTIANHKSQHVFGQYNIEDPSITDNYQRGNYVCIIGNGTGNNARSNALAIKWDGTFVFADGTEITPAQFAALKASLN